MSQDSTILGSICTCCGLFLFSSLEAWCNTKRYGCGSRSCSGPRGCCNSCFAKGFNEDSWDKDEAQRQAAESGGEGRAGGDVDDAVNENIKGGNKEHVSGEQPAPVAQMSVTSAAGDAAAPTDQAEGSKPGENDKTKQ